MEDSLTYFRVLPNELLLKVMAHLTIQSRHYFIKAYPQYKYLGQDSSLKTRSIKRSNVRLDKEDLQWLLDPNGTALELSLDRVSLIRTYFDANELMCNLQEVTLKNCRFDLFRCSWLSDSRRNKASQFMDALEKVKFLKLDGCKCLCRKEEYVTDSWTHFISLQHFHGAMAPKPEILAYHNMITMAVFKRVMKILSELCFFDEFNEYGYDELESDEYEYLRDMRIMVKNLDGESLDLAGPILKMPAPDRDLIERRRNYSVKSFFRAIRFKSGWDSQKTFRKLEVRSRNRFFELNEIELTEDFDMEMLKRKLDAMPN